MFIALNILNNFLYILQIVQSNCELLKKYI